MMFERGELKEINGEQGVKTTEDFQELMHKMMKEVLEAIYDEDLTDHLGNQKHAEKAGDDANPRNGYRPKTVQSYLEEIKLYVSRDQKSTFDRRVVKNGNVIFPA
ncbi:MAG: transposase [Limnochordia bacterium]|nr:transposase [Limnochordia bacterium]